jgi:glycerophosphoryl diester phosphodiesterase
MPFFEGIRPRVFAHRGLHTNHPENSRGAFRAAVDAGVSYIETDVVSSSDGIAMVTHDLVLDRVAGIRAAVGDFTAAQLADVDLGGEGFITLRQALADFPTTRFNVDVKDERAIFDVAAAIRDVSATERVLVSSFATVRRRAALANLPGVASSASSTEFLRVFAAVRLGFTPPLPQIQALQIPASAYGIPTVTRALVDRYHRLGLEVHVWTINDEVEISRLLQLGVDGIVTDRADVALRVVAS